MKFTGWEMGLAIEANRRFGDKVMIGYGKDEQVMAAYFFGIKCSVGSTYNWAGKIWNEGIQGKMSILINFIYCLLQHYKVVTIKHV